VTRRSTRVSQTAAAAALGLWVASCENGPERAAPPSTSSIAAARSDHKNLEYSFAGRPVLLVDGIAEEPAAPGSAASIITRYFGNEVRGDLNADGREDVAFLVTQQSGGSGTFFYAVAALDTPQGLIGSQAVLLGDRIVPRTMELLANGVIAVTYADRAPGDDFTTATSLGKSVRLKLDPATLQLAEIVQSFEGEANPAAMDLQMKTWVWVSADDGGNELSPRQTAAFTLTFGAEGTFSATTDCNGVRGSYTAQGSNLTFANLAATRMFCTDSQEQAFTQLLERVVGHSFTARGELVLSLAANAGSITFR
jgi:heat shock protein HslJ